MAEPTGHIALLNLEHVISHTAPREPRPEAPRGSGEHAVWINEVFAESISGFAHLRELMRPRELRGSLGQNAQEAIERIERTCKDADLSRSQEPLTFQPVSAALTIPKVAGSNPAPAIGEGRGKAGFFRV